MEYDPENLELLLLSKDALIEDYEQRIAELKEKCEKFRGALQAISYRGSYGGDLCSCWKVAKDALEK